MDNARKRKGVLEETEHAHKMSTCLILEEAVISLLPNKCSISRLAFKLLEKQFGVDAVWDGS